MTAAAWEDSVACPESDCDRQTHQDQSRRLCYDLFMAAFAARTKADADPQLLFELHRVPRDGRSSTAQLTTLKLVVGPGDSVEPVMTILLCWRPQED